MKARHLLMCILGMALVSLAIFMYATAANEPMPGADVTHAPLRSRDSAITVSQTKPPTNPGLSPPVATTRVVGYGGDRLLKPRATTTASLNARPTSDNVVQQEKRHRHRQQPKSRQPKEPLKELQELTNVVVPVVVRKVSLVLDPVVQQPIDAQQRPPPQQLDTKQDRLEAAAAMARSRAAPGEGKQRGPPVSVVKERDAPDAVNVKQSSGQGDGGKGALKATAVVAPSKMVILTGKPVALKRKVVRAVVPSEQANAGVKKAALTGKPLAQRKGTAVVAPAKKATKKVTVTNQPLKSNKKPAKRKPVVAEAKLVASKGPVKDGPNVVHAKKPRAKAEQGQVKKSVKVLPRAAPVATKAVVSKPVKGSHSGPNILHSTVNNDHNTHTPVDADGPDGVSGDGPNVSIPDWVTNDPHLIESTRDRILRLRREARELRLAIEEREAMMAANEAERAAVLKELSAAAALSQEDPEGPEARKRAALMQEEARAWSESRRAQLVELSGMRAKRTERMQLQASLLGATWQPPVSKESRSSALLSQLKSSIVVPTKAVEQKPKRRRFFTPQPREPGDVAGSGKAAPLHPDVVAQLLGRMENKKRKRTESLAQVMAKARKADGRHHE